MVLITQRTFYLRVCVRVCVCVCVCERERERERERKRQPFSYIRQIFAEAIQAVLQKCAAARVNTSLQFELRPLLFSSNDKKNIISNLCISNAHASLGNSCTSHSLTSETLHLAVSSQTP